MRAHRARKIVAWLWIAVVVAAAVGVGAPALAAPRYYFRVDKIESAVPIDGGTRELAREALGAELASRPEWASDLGGATSNDAIAAELKRRKLKGFDVKLKIADFKKDIKDGGTGSRFKKLTVGVKLEVLGITLPGEKLAFSGTGESAAETEVPETRLDREADLLGRDAMKDAIKQAVDQAVQRLGSGKSAPMNESRRGGSRGGQKSVK